jgi:hypothetical protein
MLDRRSISSWAIDIFLGDRYLPGKSIPSWEIDTFLGNRYLPGRYVVAAYQTRHNMKTVAWKLALGYSARGKVA